MPIVVLQLGSKLNPNDIEEGDDVYFDCVVRAHPQAYKVVWEHNVSIYYVYNISILSVGDYSYKQSIYSYKQTIQWVNASRIWNSVDLSALSGWPCLV